MGLPYERANLSRAEMQALVDSPISTGARANRVWLPLGKLPNRSSGEIADSIDPEFAPSIGKKAAKERADKAKAVKLATVLSYYAKTDISFARIAEHTRLKIEDVVREMRLRGRQQ